MSEGTPPSGGLHKWANWLVGGLGPARPASRWVRVAIWFGVTVAAACLAWYWWSAAGGDLSTEMQVRGYRRRLHTVTGLEQLVTCAVAGGVALSLSAVTAGLAVRDRRRRARDAT
jgi:hypothetical protein